jgi:hypothetical protein
MDMLHCSGPTAIVRRSMSSLVPAFFESLLLALVVEEGEALLFSDVVEDFDFSSASIAFSRKSDFSMQCYRYGKGKRIRMGKATDRTGRDKNCEYVVFRIRI